jgi:hypothetical protein
MYYVIELNRGYDMILKEASLEEFREHLKKIEKNSEKNGAFYHKDFIAIYQEKMLTTYFTCEEKRQGIVSELLNKGYKKSVDFLKERVA